MTLEAIRRRDPAFDTTRFLSRAEAVLALVLRSRAEGRPELARAVVSDEMAMRLRSELEGQRAAGRRQVHEGVRVRSADVVQAASDDRCDTVAVRFALEGVAYEARADGAPVAGASRERRRWGEVWWFQRPAGATTSAADDAPVDRCPGCGAPVAPTSSGECAYCQHQPARPDTWVLARVTEPAAAPPAALSTVTIGSGGGDDGPTRTGRAVGVLVILTVVILLTVVGAGIVITSRAASKVSEAIGGSEVLPPGVSLPPGVTMPGATPTAPPPTGFLTPVANPRVKAPVNDVPAAAAAVQALAGRPLMVSSIHLYPDGRIIFEVQAVDDPRGVDNWVWRGGTVSGPEQGLIGVDPSRLYPLAGLDLSNLARLCDAAVGSTQIPDGQVESPYLIKIGAGLRWYIPVQSTSRRSTNKTYRVAPDGTKADIF